MGKDVDVPPGRQGRRRRGKRPVLATVCLIVGGILMMTSGLGIVAVKFGFSAASRSVPQENLLGDERQGATGANGERKHVEITGPKNILMVGLDARPDQDPTEGVRADSIIIAHIPASHDGV